MNARFAAAGRTEKALRFLRRDPLLHVDMTEALRRGLGKVLAAEEDGVLLSVDEGYCGMLSCADEDTALRLLRGRSFPLLAVHQPRQEAALREALGMETWMRCRQAVYPGDATPPCQSESIRPLTGKHLDFLLAHYRREDGEYLAWLLERGAVFGDYRQGEPAGIIGKHAEGAMGLLEVLPEWRRKGIALELESFLIGRELARGNRPYCQVFPDNAPSLALQRKLGMLLTETEILWLRKTGD